MEAYPAQHSTADIENVFCSRDSRSLQTCCGVLAFIAFVLGGCLFANVARADHDIEHEVENLKGGLGAVEERVWDLEQQISTNTAPDFLVKDANGTQIGEVISFTGINSYLMETSYMVGKNNMTFLLSIENNNIDFGITLNTEYWQDSGCALAPIIPKEIHDGNPIPAFDAYVVYLTSAGTEGLFASSGDPSFVLNQFYTRSLGSSTGGCSSASGPREFFSAVEVISDITSAFPSPFTVERTQ